MSAEQLFLLERLGIDTTKSFEEMFNDLLHVAEFLYDETERNEQDRFRMELNRIKKPTN